MYLPVETDFSEDEIIKVFRIICGECEKLKIPAPNNFHSFLGGSKSLHMFGQ